MMQIQFIYDSPVYENKMQESHLLNYCVKCKVATIGDEEACNMLNYFLKCKVASIGDGEACNYYMYNC